MLQTLVAALLAGILSPLVLAFLQYRIIWRAQKVEEMKKQVFDEAIKTLAMNEIANCSINRGSRGNGAAAAKGAHAGRDIFRPH